MFSDALRRGFVLLVCACGVAAAGEPNEPWIAGEHLAPGWEAMLLSTRHYNRELPAAQAKVPERFLSFEGRIEVVDPNRLVGLSTFAARPTAFDESGNRIVTTLVTQRPIPYAMLMYDTDQDADGGQRTIHIEPFNFTVEMWMEDNAPFPTAISRLEWGMSALLSDHFEAFDIPFGPSGDWIVLTPGLEVLVEKAVVREGTYNFQMKARYDLNETTYVGMKKQFSGHTGSVADLPYSWPDRTWPLMIVTRVDVLNAEGQSVSAQSTGRLTEQLSFSLADSGNQRTLTWNQVGRCSACGEAAFIRHTIAFAPYEQEAQFVLENIPVPTE